MVGDGRSRRRQTTRHAHPLLTALTRSLATVVVLAALGAAPVHASTDLTFPGNQCSAAPDSPSPAIASPDGSNIGNPSSTQWLYVICPLIAQPFAAPINWGVVALIHAAPQSLGGMGCVLHSVNSPAYGTTTGWTQYQGATTTSLTQQWLHFGSLPGNDHYYYVCYIPPKYNGVMSSINAYRINEN